MVELRRVSYRSPCEWILPWFYWISSWVSGATRFLRIERHIHGILFDRCLLFLSPCGLDPRLDSGSINRRLRWSWRLNQIAALKIPRVLIFIKCLQVPRLSFWHHVSAAARLGSSLACSIWCACHASTGSFVKNRCESWLHGLLRFGHHWFFRLTWRYQRFGWWRQL